MVKFEKIHLHLKSWWAPVNDAGAEDHQAGDFVCPQRTCPVCNCPSKEQYKGGWTCLNDECPEHFKFEAATYNSEVDLAYTSKFLRERTKFNSGKSLEPLIPILPTTNPEDNKFGTGKAARNGIVCPRCGCCSRRLDWGGWDCENPKCTFKYTIAFNVMTAQDIYLEQQRFKAKEYLNSDLVTDYEKNVGGYKADIYTLPAEQEGQLAGGVVIFRATAEINKKLMGPDELFGDIQQVDIGLRRNTAMHPGE